MAMLILLNKILYFGVVLIYIVASVLFMSQALCSRFFFLTKYGRGLQSDEK